MKITLSDSQIQVILAALEAFQRFHITYQPIHFMGLITSGALTS